MSEATNGRLIGPTLLLSAALNEHDIKALNDYTTWWCAQLARAEKVIEWARKFHTLTVEDAQINGLICQTAEVWGARWNLGTLLDQRAAEYDRPSAPLDGRDTDA